MNEFTFILHKGCYHTHTHTMIITLSKHDKQDNNSLRKVKPFTVPTSNRIQGPVIPALKWLFGVQAEDSCLSEPQCRGDRDALYLSE